MSNRQEFPSLMGSTVLGLSAFSRVLWAPRVLLLISLSIFAIVIAKVLPIHQRVAELLDSSIGANGRLGRVIYDDMTRLHPETQLQLGASGLLVMLLWTFFSGGVLATVGVVSSRRLGIGDFLASCGSFFFRSLRCWAVFVAGLMLWTWVSLGLLAPWLEGMLVSGGNESALFRFDLGVNVVWFVGFAKLFILRRLALARLVLGERKSVLLAYASSIGLFARRAFKGLFAYAGLFVLWAIGISVCALAIDQMVEADRFPVAVVLGFVALVWTQIALIASLVLARRMWVLDGYTRAPDDETAGEPAVVMPRAEPEESPAVVEVS